MIFFVKKFLFLQYVVQKIVSLFFRYKINLIHRIFIKNEENLPYFYVFPASFFFRASI